MGIFDTCQLLLLANKAKHPALVVQLLLSRVWQAHCMSYYTVTVWPSYCVLCDFGRVVQSKPITPFFFLAHKREKTESHVSHARALESQ